MVVLAAEVMMVISCRFVLSKHTFVFLSAVLIYMFGVCMLLCDFTVLFVLGLVHDHVSSGTL